MNRITYIMMMLCAILFMGCASTDCPDGWVIDPRFPDVHKETIRNGMLRWNAFIGKEYLKENVDGAFELQCGIVYVSEEDIPQYSKDHESENGLGLVAGLYAKDTNTIYLIPSRTKAPTILHHAMHEMGHWLGLRHIHTWGVMSEVFYSGHDHPDPNGIFSPADWDECARVGICGVN